jgi:putative DNA primase/helicase
MVSSHFDIEAVRSWLEYLHGDSRGNIHLCSTGDWTGRAFLLDSPTAFQDASEYVTELDRLGREGIYLRVTTIGDNVIEGRGKDGDSVSFPGLWADIDIAGPGHKTTKPLPVDWDQAKLIIEEAGLPEPTLWVVSGGGFYPYWLLSQPYHLDIGHQEQLSALQEVSTGWQRCLGEAAERLGLFYGTQCGDLSRVLRVPGTVNRKAGLERPCEVISATGPSYRIETLVEAFASASLKLRPADDRGSYDKVPTPVAGTTPLDQFESATDWEHPDLLGGLGWQHHHTQGITTYWTRAGKQRRDGHSATTGRDGDRDRLYMFSDADTHIPAGGPYTKGYVFALIHHGGDLKAAAKALAGKGFGESRTSVPLPDTLRMSRPEPDATPDSWQPPSEAPDLTWQPQHDTGNGDRMAAMYGDTFKYVADAKKWARYNGSRWVILHNADPVKRAASEMASIVQQQAQQLVDAGDERGDKLMKWAKVSHADARTNAAVSNFRAHPNTTVTADEFDKNPRYLGVKNGVLDLGTPGDMPKLLPAHPKYMLTKQMDASYAPGAESPHWDKFIEEVLPEPELRGFLQRISGYALRGKPNRRAMAIISGPPRSGKSKFIESIGHTFGDYSATASATLFRFKRDGSSPSTDLHHLRGRRFVSTSEASESTIMDEELVKRVTGQDKMNSRGLYESPQEWLPQFVLFMATNHHPKVNPEDTATWDRLKVIRFEQEFRGDRDDPELLDKLTAEADGILNWLIAGMRDFEGPLGLIEPEAVVEAGKTYRKENDTVSQFIDSVVEEGVVALDKDATVKNSQIYLLYENWVNANRVGPAIGPRRFARRLEALGFTRSNAQEWTGLRHSPHTMITGNGYPWRPA